MLGYIPNFQFSADPRVNPYVNPHVSMPNGMYQSGTVQPAYGPASACGPMTPSAAPPVAGTQLTLLGPQAQLLGNQLGYVMIDETPNGPVPLEGLTDSWFYRNRKTIFLSSVGVAVLVALGFASMLR